MEAKRERCTYVVHTVTSQRGPGLDEWEIAPEGKVFALLVIRLPDGAEEWAYWHDPEPGRYERVCRPEEARVSLFQDAPPPPDAVLVSRMWDPDEYASWNAEDFAWEIDSRES